MKLAILSRSQNCYSTQRLREAAVKRGHRVKVLDTLRFSIDLEQGIPDLYFRSKQLSHYDAVLPRIGASITYYGTAVVRQFEQMDVITANSSAGISNSRDKLRCLQILSRHQIGIPQTTFVREKKDVLPAIERVGGTPIIIKLLEGTQGVGVILAESVKTAEAIIETLQSTRQNVLVQKFVEESKGRDIRAFVVGDRVVAAMRRVAQGDEFRSNVHRGGSTERVILDERYCETAVRSAQIMGLRVAGVDLLEGNDGPQVMEVNSSPGLEGIETCTQLDIAGAIVDYIAGTGRLPRDRFASTADGQPRLRGHRDSHTRGFRLHRKINRSFRSSRARYQRPDPVSRHKRDPQPASETYARAGRSATLLRKTRSDAKHDSREDSPQATPESEAALYGSQYNGARTFEFPTIRSLKNHALRV